jgi:glycerophosphoryl diester phosphodiesterase
MDAREKLVELPIEDALLILREEHRQRTDSYTTYLAHGGKGEPAEEVGLDALAMAISALEKTKWISVKDRVPDNKEHDWVLAQVVEDNGFMHIPRVMEYRQAKNDWFEETYGWLSEHNGLFSVTHWMPLPNPPKGE